MNIFKMLKCGVGVAALAFFAQTALAQTSASLDAAVLPSSRATAINNTVTVFATLINGGDTTATGCFVTIPPTGNPPGLTFSYRAFQSDNATPAAPADTPVDIAGQASQSFVLSVTPANVFSGTDIEFEFACDGPIKAPVIKGVNTLFLTAASTASPDIITIAVSPTGDGVVHIPALGDVEAMGVAAVNIGSGVGTAPIIVAPDTGDTPLPLDLTICETFPDTGACKSPASATVSTVIGASASTFSVFASSAHGAGVPNFPDMARLNVRYYDEPAPADAPQGTSKPAALPPSGAGEVFGGTSTGVTSPGPDSTAADTFPVGIYSIRYQDDNGADNLGILVVNENGDINASLYGANSAAFPDPDDFIFGSFSNVGAANGSAPRSLDTSYTYYTLDNNGNVIVGGNFTGSGQWNPKSNVLISFAPESGSNGTAGHYKLVYTGEFDRAVTLAGLAGSYDGVDQDQDTGVLSKFGNVTIATDGTLSGTVTPDPGQTCAVSGSLSAYPGGGNLFAVDLVLSGSTCGIADTLRGNAFVKDMEDKANNKLYANTLFFIMINDASTDTTFTRFVPTGTISFP